MSELLLLLLGVVSVAFCFRPFLRSNLDTVATSLSDTPIGRLGQRKETILQNITELDFEYNMGKLSDEDYGNLRANLKQQALEALEQIDLVRESNALLEPGRAAAKKNESKSGFCSRCGVALSAADRFCSSCGTEVSGHR